MPGRVELRTPNFVHTLVLTPPEGHGRSKPHVEVANILKSVHQSFGVELRPVPFQCFDQDAARYVAFQGHVVRRLAGNRRDEAAQRCASGLTAESSSHPIAKR